MQARIYLKSAWTDVKSRLDGMRRLNQRCMSLSGTCAIAPENLSAIISGFGITVGKYYYIIHSQNSLPEDELSRCPRCFHDITKQRLVNTFTIPSDIQPQSTQASTEGLTIECMSGIYVYNLKLMHGIGSDSHSVVYPWRWLRDHTYDPPKQRKQDTQ